MASFDISQDFVTRGDNFPSPEKFASVAPSWVLCVVRFKHAVTFSRDLEQSASLDGSEAAAERGDPLIISSDCLTVNTTTTKERHVSNLAATLIQGDVNYLTEIMPGDWLFCWMHNSEEDSTDIISRIQRKQACNNFRDGLKFVGRVYSIRKMLAVDAAGKKTARYQLVGTGFTELDSEVFFDPDLVNAEQTIRTWLGRLGRDIDNFLSQDGLDINLAIPSLVETFFGRGVPRAVAVPDGETRLQQVTGLTEGLGDAPFAYVVPKTVGSLMGKTARAHSQSGILAYADLLEAIYGVQKYSNQSDQLSFGPFIPDGITEQPFNQRKTGKKMMGLFLSQIPQWTGKSVWSILHQYLNPSVNEMYTCLRVNPEGQVMPTLVVRQLPFSSKILERVLRNHPDVTVTTFLELPRWTTPDYLVQTFDIGRGNTSRFNFVHIIGQAPVQSEAFNATAQLIRSPPVRDDQDIRRSGLRMYNETVAVGVELQRRGPTEWIQFRSDMLMGHHLTLQGTMTLFGIQSPIVEGDNFEFGGVVFHIESVAHSCFLDAEGRKKFQTTLTLSNGVNPRFVDNFVNQGTLSDKNIFVGLRPEELIDQDPSRSYEGRDKVPDPDDAAEVDIQRPPPT